MRFALANPATGRTERVRPSNGRSLTLYVCGPTVYDDAHVGHARTYLYFDVVRRHFESSGVPVRHVMNITDFEEKVSVRARELDVGWRELAKREERRFLEDLDALGIRRARALPKASDHVAEMRDAARRMVRTGRTRREGALVTYRAPPRRGRSALAPPDLPKHAVPEPGQERGRARAIQRLREFSVWQPPYEGGPVWPSPWGRGTPGWHLECYAMARRYLGLPVDLHGGGIDLLYPHHYAENEIARGLDHRPFSRHYLHTGFVLQGGAKMSKSLGNLIPLRPMIEAVGAGALRWYLGSRPYSEPVEWSEADLRRAADSLGRVRRTIAAARARAAGPDRTVGTLRTLRATVADRIATDLRLDEALHAVREWADATDARASAGFGRGGWASAHPILQEIESRIGISLIGERLVP